MPASKPVPVSPEFLALQHAVAGHYSLERELGRGGMGIVFLARDVALDRPVAIKLLPPPLAAVPALRARFLREARTAAKLVHPHVVPIHAVEEPGDLVFFVMTFVDGETVGQRVRRAGPLPSHELMRMVQEVAGALGHAHAQGVIHRDVKPDNILLEAGSGRALVTDFGIAAAAASAEEEPAAGGGVTGTPQYMSLEQAAGAAPDPRSDLYSLGATAFFAATGRLPFDAADVAGLLVRHARDPAPAVAPLAPRLPTRFAAALDRCLAKAPDQRFPSALALAAEISLVRGGGAAVEPPAAVRAFLRDEQAAGMDIATSFLMSAASLGVYAGFFADQEFAPFVFLPVSVLMLGLGAARFGQVVLAARDLVRQGYGHAALGPAVTLEARRREEEAHLAPAIGRRMLRAAGLDALTALAKTGLAYWLSIINGPVALNFLGAAGLVMFPALFFRRLWTDFRRGRESLWHRLLRGRFGKLLFGIARIGQRRVTPDLPVPGEPTALALGRAAGALYDALPADLRRRLGGGEVPALIERLQADALALHRQAADRPVAGGGARLTEAVAALEAVRLDLLRLHAGTGTPGELTRNLELARRVALEVDRMVEGRKEVELG